MRKIVSYAFIGIISLRYLNFSASVIECATSVINVEKVAKYMAIQFCSTSID